MPAILMEESHAARDGPVLSESGGATATPAAGPVETPMLETVPDEVKSKWVESIPLGRLGQPSEIAAVSQAVAILRTAPTTPIHRSVVVSERAMPAPSAQPSPRRADSSGGWSARDDGATGCGMGTVSRGRTPFPPRA